MNKILFALRTGALIPVGFEAAHFALTGSVGSWGAPIAAAFASFGLLGIVNMIEKKPKRPSPPQRFIAMSNGWQMEAAREEDVSYLLTAMRKEQVGAPLTIHEAAVMACATEVKPRPKPVIAAPVTEIKSKVILPPRKPSDFDNLIEMESHVNTVHKGDIDEDVVFEHRLKCDLCASWSPGNAAKLSGQYKIPVHTAMPRPLPLRPKLSHDIADHGEIESDHLAKSIAHKERVFMGDRFTPEEIRQHTEACETCAKALVDSFDLPPEPETFLPHEDGQLILEEPVVDLGPISIGCPMCGKGSCGCVRQHRESDPPIPQDLAEAALADAGPIHLTRPFRAFTECPRGHEGVHPFELHPDAHGVYLRSCSNEECDLTWTESSE